MTKKRPASAAGLATVAVMGLVMVTGACSVFQPNPPPAVDDTARTATATEVIPTGPVSPTSESNLAESEEPSADSVARTPTPEAGLQPYPYTTPLPPPTPTILDGVYARVVKFEGTPVPCRRCAPYRGDGGSWTLRLDAGVFRVSHEFTDFQGVGSFKVSGDQIAFFNDPNCHLDVGRYRWILEGESLRLETIEDECAFGLRASNLTAGPWSKSVNESGRADPCQPPSLEAAISGHWPKPAGCE